MVKFDAPSHGIYYAWVKGETDISIVVYAKTDFTFDHGFSEFVPKSLADASKLPIASKSTRDSQIEFILKIKLLTFLNL